MRVLMCLVGFATPFVIIIGAFKEKKLLLIIDVALCLALFLGFFVLMGYDADSIRSLSLLHRGNIRIDTFRLKKKRRSTSVCENIQSGVEKDFTINFRFSCEYMPYISSVLIETAASIAFVSSSFERVY